MPLPVMVATAVLQVEAHTGIAGGIAAGSAALSAMFLRKKPRQRPAQSTAELLAAVEGLDKRITALSADPVVTTLGTANEAMALLKATHAEDGLLRWIAGLAPKAAAASAEGAAQVEGGAGGAAAVPKGEGAAEDEEGAAEAFELLLEAYARGRFEEALEWGHVFALQNDGVVQAVTALLPVPEKAKVPLSLSLSKEDAGTVSVAVKRRLAEYNTICATQLRSSSGAGADDAFVLLSALAVAPTLPQGSGVALLATMARTVQKIADGAQMTVCGHMVPSASMATAKRFQFGVAEELMLGAYGTDATFSELRAIKRTPYRVLKATPRSLEYKVMYARAKPALKVLKANPNRFKGVSSDED